MREIEFRGLAKDGEWIYGDLIRDTVEMVGYSGNFRPVLQETVGQYTGTKDCNGKKIFEGDIITHCDDTYRVHYVDAFLTYAVFMRQEWEWYIKGSNHFKYCFQEDNEEHFFLFQLDWPVLIIGNIHENAELLK